MAKVTPIAGEDAEAVERIIEQVSGLLRSHGPRILKYYRKTERTMAIKFQVALKGDNAQMSSKTSINYTEEKVADFVQNNIDLKQGSFVFDGQEQEDENSEEAQQGMH